MNWDQAAVIARVFNACVYPQGNNCLVLYMPPKKLSHAALFEDNRHFCKDLIGTATTDGCFVRYYMDNEQRTVELGYQPTAEEKLRNWEVVLDDRPNSSDEVYLWIDEKGFRKTAKDSEYEELKSLWVTLCNQYKNP